MDLADKKPLIAVVGIIGIAIAAWLAFGFFGIQAAFIDNEVNESADDLFTTAPAETEEVEPADNADSSDDAATSELLEESVTEEPPVAEALVDDPVEEEVEDPPAEETPAEETAIEQAAAAEAAAAAAEEEAAAAEAAAAAAEEEAATPGEIVTIASGNFQSINGYSVTGDALVLNNGTEERFLRFENFVSDNGPDLKVYLRAASGEFISLGDLSGNIGDQNYAIPVDVDLSVFSNVEIWCERFSAGFGFATLS